MGEYCESPKLAWERGYDEGRSDGEKEASGGPHYPVPSYTPPNGCALDKYLNPISAYGALRAIDAELYMVTQYGPKVGESYDQISAEHVYAAKMMIEALIKAQKP